jgi:hypothetical protein
MWNGGIHNIPNENADVNVMIADRITKNYYYYYTYNNNNNTM